MFGAEKKQCHAYFGWRGMVQYNFLNKAIFPILTIRLIIIQCDKLLVAFKCCLYSVFSEVFAWTSKKNFVKNYISISYSEIVKALKKLSHHSKHENSRSLIHELLLYIFTRKLQKHIYYEYYIQLGIKEISFC